MNHTFDIESLQKMHRDALEKARQTNLDSDWNDAQSIEHTIAELKQYLSYFRDVGERLGTLEAFAKTILHLHGGSTACNLLKEINPVLYCELLEGVPDAGHKSAGV